MRVVSSVIALHPRMVYACGVLVSIVIFGQPPHVPTAHDSDKTIQTKIFTCVFIRKSYKDNSSYLKRFRTIPPLVLGNLLVVRACCTPAACPCRSACSPSACVRITARAVWTPSFLKITNKRLPYRIPLPGSRRSWYAYYTKFDEADIKDVIDALTTKNRTVKGWEGKVSLSDLGYSAAGIDEGCVDLEVYAFLCYVCAPACLYACRPTPRTATVSCAHV